MSDGYKPLDPMGDAPAVLVSSQTVGHPVLGRLKKELEDCKIERLHERGRRNAQLTRFYVLMDKLVADNTISVETMTQIESLFLAPVTPIK